MYLGVTTMASRTWKRGAPLAVLLVLLVFVLMVQFTLMARLAKEPPSKLPLIQKSSTNNEKKKVSLPDYYMVFSTSCNLQQDWESFVFFYHAFKVGQPGNVTRILSGCDEKGAQEAVEFFQRYIQPLSEGFQLHLTPDYADLQTVKKKSYKYMNKPYGVRHWMEHALGLQENEPIPDKLAESIVMLLDPDMILMRPLVHDFTDEDVIWVEDRPASMVVKKGFPIAMQDGE